MNLKDLEIALKGLRNKEASGGAYPVKTSTINILEFLTKYSDPIKSNGEIVFLDEKNKYKKYYNITTTSDIINNNLNVVGMAYDSMVDRFITWFKEQFRVESYEKSLRNGSHIGTIGIIDLQKNIESLESLLNEVDFLDYQAELENEINYWKSYYYEKDGKTIRFRYYVIVGKNRSLFAIPKIYEKYVKAGNIEQICKLLEIDLKIWTKYVSKEFKAELYRNEKDNMKDTELQELIGWGGPITEFIALYPQEKLPKGVINELFDDEALLMIKDRELLVDLYAIHRNEYGGADVSKWIRRQFVEGRKIQTDFKKYLNFYMNVMKAWITFRNNGEYKRWPITSGHSWRILLFALCKDILDNRQQIDLTKSDSYKKIIEVALEIRADLEDENLIYGWLSKGTAMRVKDLMTGLRGSQCYYDKDFKPFDNNFSYSESKMEKSKSIIFGYQYDVMTEIFFDKVWKKLSDENMLVLPAKRGFSPSEVSYIVKRDECKVRINGEVYNSKNEVVRFSDEYPNDPYILGYGTEHDYITLRYSIMMGDDIQIDHIPAYTKNKETNNLEKCEATTSTYNNWKNNREAVYEATILEEIMDRKQTLIDAEI
jgi:hypothetical protein